MNRRWKWIASFTIVSVLTLFAAAFRLLWIRFEIHSEAKDVARLEYQGDKARDELRILESTVLEAVQPHILRERVEGVMATPREGQVIRMRGFGDESACLELKDRRLAA
jgi:hypothetical protein